MSADELKEKKAQEEARIKEKAKQQFKYLHGKGIAKSLADCYDCMILDVVFEMSLVHFDDHHNNDT